MSEQHWEEPVLTREERRALFDGISTEHLRTLCKVCVRPVQRPKTADFLGSCECGKPRQQYVGTSPREE